MTTLKSNTPPSNNDKITMTMKLSCQRMAIEGDSYIDMMMMLYDTFLERGYKVIIEIYFELTKKAIQLGETPTSKKLKKSLKECQKGLYKPAYVERINFLKYHTQEEWDNHK